MAGAPAALPALVGVREPAAGVVLRGREMAAPVAAALTLVWKNCHRFIMDPQGFAAAASLRGRLETKYGLLPRVNSRKRQQAP